MTPSQEQLRAYLAAKIAELSADKFTSSADVTKTAAASIAADVPVAVTSLFNHLFEPMAKEMGQAVFAQIATIARDVSKRGIPVVLKEAGAGLKRVKTKLDMQYQRGLERKRRNHK